MPYSVGDRRWAILDGRVVEFMYVDQDDTHEEGCCCVQAFVALADSTQESGTIEFLKGSHHEHAALARRLCDQQSSERDEWEFLEIPDADGVFEFCPLVQPCVRAGDVVLWDARTAHRVVRPSGDAPRMVAYVCMVPRHFADAEATRRRRWAFENAVATTHWPHRVVDRGDAWGRGRRLERAPTEVQRLV